MQNNSAFQEFGTAPSDADGYAVTSVRRSVSVKSGRSDSNRRRPAWEAASPEFQSLSEPEVTSIPASGCTGGCTSTAETANAGTVEALAAALLALSPRDRARLVAMLLGQGAKGGTGDNAP